MIELLLSLLVATYCLERSLYVYICPCIYVCLLLMPNVFYICPFVVWTIMTAHSYVWIFVNIEQIQFLLKLFLLHLHWNFSKVGLQDSYHPWDGLCCDNSCGKVVRFIFHSRDIINEKSCCDKHKSNRVNWLIYVLIFLMSAETSLCVSCALFHQHPHKLWSLAKSRLHVHSRASI